MKLFLAILLFTSQGFSAFPPTTSKGQSQSLSTTTFNFQAPYNQFTKTSSINALLESDYANLLANPSFEALVGTTSWSSGSGASGANETTTKIDMNQAVNYTLTAVNGLVVSQNVNPTQQLVSQNMEAGMWVKTALTTLQVCAILGGVNTSCRAVLSDNIWHYYPVNFSGVAGGTTMGVTLITTGSTSGTAYVDGGYVGLARNLSQVSQASFFGGMEQGGTSGCNYLENSSSSVTNFIDLGAGTGCNGWTSIGNVSAVGTNDHRMVLSNMAPGMYNIKISGEVYVGTTGLCNYRLSDGTNVYQSQNNTNGGTSSASPLLEFHVPITTSQSSVTYKIQAADNQTAGCGLVNDTSGGTVLSWKVYYFPSSSQLALASNVYPAFGAFNTAATFAEIPVTGTTYTTIASSTLATKTFVPGGSCAASGTANNYEMTCTLPAGSYRVSTTDVLRTDSSSVCAHRIFDGTNTVAEGFAIGAAGSSHGNLEGIVTYSSQTTATFSVQHRRVASGTTCYSLGGSASGYQIVPSIILTPLNSSTNVPLLIGSVSSSTAGKEGVERVAFSGNSGYSANCTADPCTVNSSTPSVTVVNRAGTGGYIIRFAAGTFTAAPSCGGNMINVGVAGVVWHQDFASSTSTQVNITCNNASSNCAGVITCQGPK